jgi:hypothetical protein
MKKAILLFSFFTILFACTNDGFSDIQNDPELVGSWKMSGYLSDPGDGSGQFTAVESKKVINFSADGSLTCNGDLCSMLSTSTDMNTSGIYLGNSIILDNLECNNEQDLNIRYQRIGDTLLLYYPCKEPCFVEYKK